MYAVRERTLAFIAFSTSKNKVSGYVNTCSTNVYEKKCIEFNMSFDR